MTHSSCVSHPSFNQYLKIHKWQILACNEDICSAALLSHIECLYNGKIKIDKHNKHVNDVAELHGETRKLSEDVLIPVKLSVLRKALFGLAAEKKISKSLDTLVEKGFISEHDNPDPEKILDRTKYIRFYPEKCNAWIRENYDNSGVLINKSCGQITDSAKRQPRNGEKAESIRPKGRVDNVKKETRFCQNAESKEKQHIPDKKDLQLVDFSDNAKRETRLSEKAESILPNGVIYNNINQSIPININQDVCENINQPIIHELNAEKLTSSISSVTSIMDALITVGFSCEKFNYPDALPEINRLMQLGADVELFIKAHEISTRATGGKRFGVRYLVKVVEGLLKKLQIHQEKSNIPSQHPTKNKPIPCQTKGYVYENDLKNAGTWAADLI